MGHRFMYQNLIGDAAAISATSAESGFVGAGVPRVANGGGSMIFSGAYSGDGQEVYAVEIDTPGDVGDARFKWRKTSTPKGGWEAWNVPTAPTDAALDSDVKVRFVNGAHPPAFALGDRLAGDGEPLPLARKNLRPRPRLRGAERLAARGRLGTWRGFRRCEIARRPHRPPAQLRAGDKTPDSGERLGALGCARTRGGGRLAERHPRPLPRRHAPLASALAPSLGRRRRQPGRLPGSVGNLSGRLF